MWPFGLLHRVLIAAVAFVCVSGVLEAESDDLTPTASPPADGQFAQAIVAGEDVWQNTGTASFLYFKRPTSFAFTPGQTLYVRVTYFDDVGGGRLDARYDSQTAAFTNPVVHTRTSRVASGRFVDGFFEFTNVAFSGRMNGSDFRLICGAPGGVPFSIQRVTLSDEPFADPDFQLAITRPWQSRYNGPAKDYVDPTSLKGKVMAGYQGWFRTPNDIEDGGWRHWISGQTMAPENFTVDMWPDLTEYDPATLFRAGDVMTAGGAPAHIFSSASYPAVLKHFRWMRKHNIDGAWLQRFRMHAGSEADFVLRNISQAAAEEGRVWGVEYDVSGKSDSAVLGLLQADWQWLTSQFDILNDPRYVHEDGKPVVFIWGLSVPDRGFTPATADAVVDWFKAQGCHVIGGIPNVWSGLSAAWQTHIAKYDGVLVWMSNNTSEVSFFNNRGQDYYPHIWPGFSWAHLKKQPANPPTQYTDRQGGQFYWDKGRQWINAGADRLFLGMFDEYDESTAIMPMTNDPPPPHTEYGRFINNQGRPSDWWMMLSDELKRMMWGQRPNTGTLPTEESLANRSNIGLEASIDLGATDVNNSLTRVNNGDGDTIVETVGEKECRGNDVLATDRYMYFNVNNAFAFQLANGDVTIEVEYFDSFYGSGSGTVLGLQYDSTSTVPANPAFTNHPQNITTTNSGTWRTVRFEIADAYFGGRQNGGADFRLNFNGKKLNVNRVWVRLPEPKAYPFTWTNATAGPALNWSQNANWLGGIVAQSDPTSVVRLFPEQTMAGGTVPISNNVGGQVFNRLHLGGTAAPDADTTVNLTGIAITLDGTAPEIQLEAVKSAFDLTYDIATHLTISGTVQITGEGDATFRIPGAIDGTGTLAKTGASAVALAGANTFPGGVSLQAGAIHINSAGVAGTSGPLGNGGTFTINGGTIDNTSGSAKTLANINPIVVGGDFQFGSAGGTGANNLNLPGSVDLGGTARTITTLGTSVLTLSGAIDNGGLVKTGGGQITLSGANTFGGGVTIRNGTLNSISTSTTLGTGVVTMGGEGSDGATYLTGRNNSNAFVINTPDSGSVAIGANGAGSGFTLGGPITLNGDLTFQTFPNTGTGVASSASIAGGITGTGNLLLNNFGSRANFININTTAVNHSGSITVQGEGTGNVSISAGTGPNVTDITQNSATSLLILGGANSYSGNSTVNVGTLRITQAPDPANANPGNDASTVTIAATGATLDLTYSGTDKVDKLFIGTEQMDAGVYGKVGSSAPVIGLPQITGNGTLTVTSGLPLAGYALWASTNAPTTGDDPDADEDNDGVANAIEYVLGGTLATRDADKLPQVSTPGDSVAFSFQRDQASIDGTTTVEIQVGTNLVDWPPADTYMVPDEATANNPGVTVTKNSPPGFDTVTLVIPNSPATGRFVRLRVTP